MSRDAITKACKDLASSVSLSTEPIWGKIDFALLYNAAYSLNLQMPIVCRLLFASAGGREQRG